MDTEEEVTTVIGVPLFNAQQRGHLEEAVSSLLKQTYTHAAFVFLDDHSSDNTFAALSTITAGHPRVHIERNDRRLGLITNWRRVFERGRQLFPNAVYFAWGSDHDRWHEHWLERLVAELDSNPAAAMAYPRVVRINEAGEAITHPWPVSARREFIAPATQKTGAGNLIYGLYRATTLQRAGVFPRVYRPDVYVITELSLYGDICFVPETLWFRRERSGGQRGWLDRSSPRLPARRGRWLSGLEVVRSVVGIGPISRQHRYLFPGRVPLYARLPSSTQHAALLFWRLSVLGRGRPAVTRTEGAKVAVRLLRSSLVQGNRARRPDVS